MLSLLDDPILSCSTADEITIVDERIGGREVGEGGGDESEESKDEDSDAEEEEEEEEEERDTNDIKTLPCYRNCASQEFYGCDDKCTVDDLTPYQVIEN